MIFHEDDAKEKKQNYADRQENGHEIMPQRKQKKKLGVEGKEEKEKRNAC